MKRLFYASVIGGLSMAAVAVPETHPATEVFWPDAQPKVEAGDGVRLVRNGDELAVFVVKAMREVSGTMYRRCYGKAK